MSDLNAYRAPWFQGGAYGILSFAVGACLSWYFIGFGQLPDFAISIADWKVKMWYVFNAHFVEISQTLGARGDSFPIADQLNLINLTGGYLPFLYVFPFIGCILGGILLNVRMGGSSKMGYSILNGLQIVVGYLPTVLVLAFISAHSVSGFGLTARVGPDYVTTAILAGIVVPAVGGAIGGFVYHFNREL